MIRKEFINQKFLSWDFSEILSLYKKNICESKLYLFEYMKILIDIGIFDELITLISELDMESIKQANDNGLLESEYFDFIDVFCVGNTSKNSKSNKSCNHNKIKNILLENDLPLLEYFFVKNKDVLNRNTSKIDCFLFNSIIYNLTINNHLSNDIAFEYLKFLKISKNNPNVGKKFILQTIIKYKQKNKNFFSLKKYGNELREVLALAYWWMDSESGASDVFNLIINEVKESSIKIPVLEEVPPKVAVCISGKFRINSEAIESINENFIVPLNADVFIHTWEEGELYPGLGGAGDFWIERLLGSSYKNIAPMHLDSKNYFKANFPETFNKLDKPIKTSISKEKVNSFFSSVEILIENESNVFDNLGFESSLLSTRGHLNQAKMFYSMSKCTDILIKHENMNNMKYDFIVRLRPDLTFDKKASYSLLFSIKDNQIATNFTQYGPSDQFFIAKRNSAIAMTNIWKYAVKKMNLSPFEEYPNRDSHMLTLLWLLENNLTIKKLPIKRTIQSISDVNALPLFNKELETDMLAKKDITEKIKEDEAFFKNLINGRD